MVSTYSIETVPFPGIVLDQDDRVCTFNSLLSSHIGEVKAGDQISDIFSVWEKTPGTKLVDAVHDGKSFLFIESCREQHHFFIGIETAFLAELAKQNKKLEKMNRELDTVIENSYDGIYITDSKGDTWKTNSAIERITGIPKEYYLNKNVDELVDRGILKNSVTKKVVEFGRTVSYVQKNYAGKETLLTGTPVFNEENEVEKIVTNIRDLSDLNELQEELTKLNQLNDRYKKELSHLKNKHVQLRSIVTQSSQMKAVYETAERIADINATVLILGETGVGKDVLAKYIYEKGTRSKEGEFLKINCGAIPPDLLESELFGYEPGAFTGASQKGKPGMFEIADKGILFMDEVGELPIKLQIKLLQVLQEGEIQRVGGLHTKKVDVRIIAATNRNLEKMVAEGGFREDLYYRLKVIPIHIPPLRERSDDILPLVRLFLNQINDKYQLNKEFDQNLKEFLLSYEWPGNIRELYNLIERMAVTAKSDKIPIENLPPEHHQGVWETNEIISLKEATEAAEQEIISTAVKKLENTYEVARALKTSQPTIVRKMKKYKIKFDH
ncbi:PAS domain S-box-containing protein [Lentibacillus halodurans]|uniref:HTH-type transcriptional regulatory protein TyrR n=1 Tax=Lentibacillus halodurans TaxID=237679 RepID=A0A1I0ZAR8_9BACI|nr:sigma 54-interacting transcriptional regulator [Lentibacillus halodurans]SFB22621.1 PAS domain S-box-containing protein [Lentibacillus halodurans]